MLEDDLEVEYVGEIAPRKQTSEGVTIIEEDDGSSFVDLFGSPDAVGELSSGEFNENIAEIMTDSELTRLADQLIEYAQVDEENRTDWKRRIAKALEHFGIKEPPSNSVIENASRAVHPLIVEATIQFNARAIEEYFPATGPVKATIAGVQSAVREAQRKRVEDYMNYYLTKDDRGFYPDSDQMLMMLPLWGSMFKKVAMSPVTMKPCSRFVTADDFIAPNSGTTLEDMPRYAHRYYMTGADIRIAQANREFLDVQMIAPNNTKDRKGQELKDLADFRNGQAHADDENYEILEYTIVTRFEGIDEDVRPGIDLPYRITLERENRQILQIKREWKEGDGDAKKRIRFSHYKFMPGFGFYGFGFLHVIGSLADAASDTLRALLDSAMAANFQGGFMAKEGRMSGGVRLQFGEWVPVEATAEELAKSFYTPPFREPSQALFNLLGGLVDMGRRVASITEAITGNADNRAPVGTTVALIEEGMKVFSAIHKRMHSSAMREYELLAELIHECESITQYPYELEFDEINMLKEDFDARIDILPVSDPNIYSSSQRIAIAQAVLQAATSDPMAFGPKQKREAYKRLFEALRVPEMDKVLPPDTSPKYLDAASENAMMMVGKGVRAYETQDHDLHLRSHQMFAQTVVPTLPPELQQPVLDAIGMHAREHVALKYRVQIAAQMGVPLPPLDLDGENEPLPPEIEAAITTLVAGAMLPTPPPTPEQEAEAAAVMNEEKRKDLAAIGDEERKNLKFIGDEKRAETKHQLELRRQTEKAQNENLRADQSFAADMIRQREQTNLDLTDRVTQSALDREDRRMQQEEADGPADSG